MSALLSICFYWSLTSVCLTCFLSFRLPLQRLPSLICFFSCSVIHSHFLSLTHTNTCTCAHIHACVHTHTHTHTHTLFLSISPSVSLSLLSLSSPPPPPPHYLSLSVSYTHTFSVPCKPRVCSRLTPPWATCWRQDQSTWQLNPLARSTAPEVGCGSDVHGLYPSWDVQQLWEQC